MVKAHATSRKRELSSEKAALRALSSDRSHSRQGLNIERRHSVDGMEFEDDFGDTFEEEEVVDCADEDAELREEDEEEEITVKTRVWDPRVDVMEEGEELVCEPGTYDMLHKANVEWPCLTFDIMSDSLGAARTKYPHTAYVVTGTQADREENNRLYVMKWSQLNRTKNDEADESDYESDDEEDDARLDFRMIPHVGGVNRIRAMPQMNNIVATWSDTGAVHMWDLQKHMQQLDGPVHTDGNPTPLFSYHGHTEEGFAMAWCPHNLGRFASGDCAGAIALWDRTENGWDIQTLGHHEDSVEDLQFKIKGIGAGHVLASASVDRSVRLWDLRTNQMASVIEECHSSDVNVLAWNPMVGELLLTGADDGSFKVWDVRRTAEPMANFHWHQQPITAVSWHPSDETCLAVSSADNTVSIWDLSVEADEMEPAAEGCEDIPPQMLFLHMGQKDIKEMMWHPQIPSVIITTASDGFNIFKPCNL